MTLTMFLALREIARAKLRFALLSGAIGLLVFLITFQQGLFGGLITSFVGAVENQNAPILVFNEQARQNVEGSFLFPDQVAAVAEVEGVAQADPIGQGTFTVEVRPGGDEPTDEDAVLFASVGRLSEQKGLDVLLDAFAQLPTEVAERCVLLVVGEGELRAELERKADALGVAE